MLRSENSQTNTSGAFMIKIGNVVLGSKPEIVLAVGEYSDDQSKAYANGVSILEIRIDQFSQFDTTYVENQLKQYKQLGMPLIATIRAKSDNGGWDRNEQDREKLFLAILDLVDAIDIEIDSTQINSHLAKACKKAKKTLIVSNHHFGETPSNVRLNKVVKKAKALKADIVKLAYFAEEPNDVTRLLEYVHAHQKQGLVGISMGPIGSISRIVAPLFGSLLTYTSEAPSAGQLPLTELVDISRKLYPSFNQELINSRKLMESI